MTYETCRTIPADHPSLPGHFPGEPIVPAVVILDEVATALAEWQTGCRVSAIPAVKFLGPLKPDQRLTIAFSKPESAGNDVDFSCRLHDRVIVRGRLLISGQPS